MVGYTTVTLGSETLNITSISARKTQKTKKVVIGKQLVEVEVLGYNETQWEIDLYGYLTASDLATLYSDRSNLEALDDLSTHSYSDGIHDGTFYIRPGSLVFEDTEETAGVGLFLRYSMSIVEE